MAKVLVKVYTTLKERLGTCKLLLEADTAADVIAQVVKAKEPEIAPVLLDEKGIVKNHFVLTLNSKILDHAEVARVKMSDGDIFHIFPPVSGG